MKQVIQQVTDFKEGYVPFIYPGAPVGFRKLAVKSYDLMIYKIAKKNSMHENEFSCLHGRK